MAWEKTEWACGHKGSMQLYGKQSDRNAKIAYEAGRQCMVCWLVDQWQKKDDPRAKRDDVYKIAADIAENKGKRIDVSNSVNNNNNNSLAKFSTEELLIEIERRKND